MKEVITFEWDYCQIITYQKADSQGYVRKSTFVQFKNDSTQHSRRNCNAALRELQWKGWLLIRVTSGQHPDGTTQTNFHLRRAVKG